ncbi:uncharacterized protein LOC62_02G003008 [Vanrija pseudolonga]|uniref:DNA replication regulator Sld3 C-terminal domain-containing protein n=1 Tax=Vanrija pseudolonga TaxID=143232 RepID=A0AAF0Y854_9TREE|nr:hypothetical protein LOC62_02G003008 [Vanrija pseudolonga]
MGSAALVGLPQAIALAQPRALPQLPHTLDLSCPIPLPTNKARVPWPWPVAGPSSVPDEQLDVFIARRYYETLYLSDTLAPLAGFVADLERVLPADSGAALVPHLLALGDIEARHRKTLAPVVSAALQSSAAVEEAVSAEHQVLAVAVDLRAKSRAAVEGGRVPRAKALTEEFEHREVLVQIISLLLYRTREGKRTQEERAQEKEAKKERKKRKLSGPVESPHPSKDPDLALELLADRVSVWQVMSQLDLGGLGLPESQPKPDPAGGMAAVIKKFWADVLVPFFIQKQHSFCASFHVKVFGAELPAELVQKKPRKPKVTRKLSLDARDDEPNAVANPPAKLRRTVSHAPHTSTRRPSSPERGRDASLQQHRERTIQRSMSRVSDRTDRSRTVEGDLSRRSRSSSIDPAPVNRPKPSIVRAPSGKDLFKGREVGLLRRSNSVRLPPTDSQSQSQSQSQPGRGLFGRRTNSTQLPPQSQTQSQSQSQSQTSAETLVLATPAKPKHSAFFARAHTQQWHPTPIREEPSSAERSYSYVAETPGRRSANGSSVAETPRGSSHSRVAETPAQGARSVAETPIGGSRVASTPLGGGAVADTPLRGAEIDYDDDDLGALMVPTDEEDEGEGDDGDHSHGFGGLLAPETPRKGW